MIDTRRETSPRHWSQRRRRSPLAFLPACILAAALVSTPAAHPQELALTGQDRPIDADFEEVFRVGAVDGEPWELFASIKEEHKRKTEERRAAQPPSPTMRRIEAMRAAVGGSTRSEPMISTREARFYSVVPVIQRLSTTWEGRIWVGGRPRLFAESCSSVLRDIECLLSLGPRKGC